MSPHRFVEKAATRATVARVKQISVAFAAVLALTACGGASDDQLVRRASFDLNCPEAEIRVTNLGGESRGVTACGQRATYVYHCERTGYAGMCESGNWILNGTSGGESR